MFPYREVNGKAKHEPNSSRKERPQKRGGGGRFEPYGNVNKRYRVFVSNIPYDVKWQALKDLMKDKGMASISDYAILKKFLSNFVRSLLILKGPETDVRCLPIICCKRPPQG